MKELLFVGLGGFLGAASRYKLSGFILHHTADWKFPAGTFVVNILGCCLAGLLAGLVEKHDFFTPEARLLVFPGILGGFTTFSAFGLETIYLFQRQEWFLAAANVLLSVVCGLLALWICLKSVS
jgi:fluoride exporter